MPKLGLIASKMEIKQLNSRYFRFYYRFDKRVRVIGMDLPFISKTFYLPRELEDAEDKIKRFIFETLYSWPKD